jgi:hypothetical protein
MSAVYSVNNRISDERRIFAEYDDMSPTGFLSLGEHILQTKNSAVRHGWGYGEMESSPARVRVGVCLPLESEDDDLGWVLPVRPS